jgi:hypothetical protein
MAAIVRLQRAARLEKIQRQLHNDYLSGH